MARARRVRVYAVSSAGASPGAMSLVTERSPAVAAAAARARAVVAMAVRGFMVYALRGVASGAFCHTMIVLCDREHSLGRVGPK